MKFFKYLLITILIIGGLGYSIYYFGSNIISDKVAENISADLNNSDNLNEVKQVVDDLPTIKEFIQDGANIDMESLPFTTKEQAAKIVVEKIGLVELQKIQSKFQNGISEDEVAQLLKDLEGKLTEEEILALKAIAFNELNK